MEDWVKQIQDRTKKVPISSGRTDKINKVNWDDLIFLPAQLAKKPKDYFKEEISSKTVVGKLSKKPMKIDVPIIIAAMSFGALSCEAKIALAKASKLAGTIANTGEGGMLEGEREFSRRLIIQYSTGRFGISEDVLKKADAIEIKIGQGAKPGQGGMLLKEKITDKIAKIRGIDKTKDVHSPAYHSDINNIDDLKKKVDWLREISDGVPIIIKLGAGDVEQDVKLSVQAGCDIIAIDGMEGGTGAAPEVMLNDVGLPALAALAKARETLDEINAKQELWLGGGLSKGADFAKAIALGADAVFVGFPLLVAMGCIYCKKCYLGKCPKGICTQDIELRYQFDVEENANNAANYIKNCNEEIKMIAGACGKDNIHNLRKDDLRAMNSEISKITNVKLI
jgi:glutamate synthase domain-containing protein 2